MEIATSPLPPDNKEKLERSTFRCAKPLHREALTLCWPAHCCFSSSLKSY